MKQKKPKKPKKSNEKLSLSIVPGSLMGMNVLILILILFLLSPFLYSQSSQKGSRMANPPEILSYPKTPKEDPLEKDIPRFVPLHPVPQITLPIPKERNTIPNPLLPPSPEFNKGIEVIMARKTLINSKLISALNKILKNPKKLEIKIEETPDEKFILGIFNLLRVDVEDAVVDGLNIKKATFFFKEINLSLDRLLDEEILEIPVLNSVGLDARITEKDLNTLVQTRVKEVSSPRIALKKGKIILSGKARLGGLIPLKFRAAGEFEVREGTEVNFIADGLKISGLPVPFATRAIAKINPILKLNKFPFSIQLKGIDLYPGFIHFYSDEKFREILKSEGFQVEKSPKDAQKKEDKEEEGEIQSYNRERDNYLNSHRRR